MNWPPTFPLRARTPLALATAGLLALAATAAEKAKFSAPTDKDGSSLAPLKPSDTGNDFGRLFERQKTQLPGFDLPPSTEPNSKQAIDPQARKRFLEQMDKKRNWMSNDGKNELRDGKGKDKDKGEVDLQPDRPRTLFEKNIQAEEQAAAERSDKDKKNAKEQGLDRSDDGSGDEDGRPGDGPAKQAKDSADSAKSANGFERAKFSDPFSSPFSQKPAERSGGFFTAPSTAKEEQPGFARPSSSERVDQMINGAAPAGASLSRTESGAFGASPSARAREFQSILDGNSSATTRTPNAFDTPATAPRSFAPSAAAPLPSLSAGFLSPASGQFTPSRAFEPAMKPQPGVLPFPTRR